MILECSANPSLEFIPNSKKDSMFVFVVSFAEKCPDIEDFRQKFELQKSMVRVGHNVAVQVNGRAYLVELIGLVPKKFLTNEDSDLWDPGDHQLTAVNIKDVVTGSILDPVAALICIMASNYKIGQVVLIGEKQHVNDVLSQQPVSSVSSPASHMTTVSSKVVKSPDVRDSAPASVRKEKRQLPPKDKEEEDMVQEDKEDNEDEEVVEVAQILIENKKKAK